MTAKVDLHKKTEVKEQLTEHLYAIIQQNELRKANKLEELMQQLNAAEEVKEERGDALVQIQVATKHCQPSEEDEGGDVQQPAETQQQPLENGVQKETVAS